MIIALFGISCVGKTTIGKIIGKELNYEFFDLDREMISYYCDTITNIQNSCFNRHAFDGIKITVLKDILTKCSDNAVIAISPIYYTATYKKPFREKQVISIELQDSPENIAKRLVYTDENDNIIENHLSDIKQEIKDVKYFISHYRKAFSHITIKYHINGKTALEAAREIIDTIITA